VGVKLKPEFFEQLLSRELKEVSDRSGDALGVLCNYRIVSIDAHAREVVLAKTSTGTFTQTVNSSADMVRVNSVPAAVDQVLGAVQVESAAQSPIDELALGLVTTQSRRRRVGMSV
jgi:hypothetical protein